MATPRKPYTHTEYKRAKRREQAEAEGRAFKSKPRLTAQDKADRQAAREALALAKQDKAALMRAKADANRKAYSIANAKKRRPDVRRMTREQADGSLPIRGWQRRLLGKATRCAYCAQPLTHDSRPPIGTDASTDHVMPLSRGGVHGVSNVVVACLSCNGSKGDRTVAEWMVARQAKAKSQTPKP